jgi:hypothetical protein
MFHSLPHDGGVLQQDNKIMRRLHRVGMARNAALKTEQERQAAEQRLRKKFGA